MLVPSSRRSTWITASSPGGNLGATANASSTISTGPQRFNVRTIGIRGEASSCRTHWMSPSTPKLIRV
jgi:hypothetical protein